MENQIRLPKCILQKFLAIANENLDEKGQKIETLAYFLGDSESKIIDTILFPRQFGTPSRVNDEGNANLYINSNSVIVFVKFCFDLSCSHLVSKFKLF